MRRRFWNPLNAKWRRQQSSARNIWRIGITLLPRMLMAGWRAQIGWSRVLRRRESARRAAGFLRIILKLLFAPWRLTANSAAGRSVGLVSVSVYLQRRPVCRQCELYNRKTTTCGTPPESFADPQTGALKPLGCGCLMVFKSWLAVNCWLAEQTAGKLGWPRALNSHPEDYE